MEDKLRRIITSVIGAAIAILIPIIAWVIEHPNNGDNSFYFGVAIFGICSTVLIGYFDNRFENHWKKIGYSALTLICASILLCLIVFGLNPWILFGATLMLGGQLILALYYYLAMLLQRTFDDGSVLIGALLQLPLILICAGTLIFLM